MPDENTFFDAVKIVGLCIMWYASSASGNIVGKLLLTDFPYPMTVTMVQLLSISLYLAPMLRCQSSTIRTANIPRAYYLSVIIPLALGKFLASVSSHISIWKVSVSYAHTVKATLPLFTVVLSRILLGVKQSVRIYLSLLPIIGGVIIATVTELSFDIVGLLSALLSTMGFSLMTIYSKKCLKDTGVHHIRLLVMLAQWAALCFFPVWFLYDLRRIITNIDTVTVNIKLTTVIALLLLDGLFNTLQNLIAFTILALVTPLSYAVANAMKRIVIITASIIMLQNPVTPINCLGMLIAILGVFFYNKAKYDQNCALLKEMILPTVRNDTNLLLHNSSMEHYQNDGRLQNGILLSNAKPDVKILPSEPWTSTKTLESRPHMESKARDSRDRKSVV